MEQDTIRKGLVGKKTAKHLKFGNNNKEYKVESICKSAVYTIRLETGHLSVLYYLVSWKDYSKDKNT